MFCKKCGHFLGELSYYCRNCKCKPFSYTNFCQNCGEKTLEEQEICFKCLKQLKVCNKVYRSNRKTIKEILKNFSVM